MKHASQILLIALLHLAGVVCPMHRACPGLMAEAACCHDVQDSSGDCGHHLFAKDPAEQALAAHQAPSPVHPCHETCLCLEPAGLFRLAAVQGPDHAADLPRQCFLYFESPNVAETRSPRASALASNTLTFLRTIVLRT